MNRGEKLIKTILLLLLSLAGSSSFAQPTDDLPGDPGAFVVNKAQDLNFGAFTVASGGGTITLSSSGTRSATGNVTLLNMGYLFFPAIFDLEAPEGTIVSILMGPSTTLSGNNGGTINLQLGNPSPASPFSTMASPPATTPVHIGGTLTLSGTSPPGTYTGTFSVTFNYQ